MLLSHICTSRSSTCKPWPHKFMLHRIYRHRSLETCIHDWHPSKHPYTILVKPHSTLDIRLYMNNNCNYATLSNTCGLCWDGNCADDINLFVSATFQLIVLETNTLPSFLKPFCSLSPTSFKANRRNSFCTDSILDLSSPTKCPWWPNLRNCPTFWSD